MISEKLSAPVAALDLDPIKVKLMHQESGEGWTLAYADADAVEFEYRRFLHLVKLFPNEHAAPLFDVDVFWHYHILDTMKYAADCDEVFGYFLHHFPYVGLGGDADKESHRLVGARMQELYEYTYGETAIQERQAESVVARDKTASSVPTSNVASSISTTRFAFSVPTVTTASPPSAGRLGRLDVALRTAPAHFHPVRPTLSRPA